jgi:hypothetical protein
VCGSLQEHVPVLRSEVRGQQGDSGQVKTAVLEQGPEHGVLSRGPSDRDAQISFGLRQVEDLRAVDEHGE